MRIGFIGAGRVGFTLGKYLSLNGTEISGYYSRNPEHAKEAARFTDTRYYVDINDLIKESDAVFLTVSDTAISTVYDSIRDYADIQGKIICHTSGALSSEVFENGTFQVYGYSVHPVYAVSDKYTSYENFSNAFITIEGNEKYLEELTGVFKSAGLSVGTIDTDAKVKYHAACVVASNLVCGLYGMSTRLLTECGMTEDMSREAIKGLFVDNALGLAEKGATGQLTGPIDRNDVITVNKHLNTLSETDGELYKKVSEEVLKVAKEKNKNTDYSDMEKILK